MTTTLNKRAYQQLTNEDIEWLMTHPRTPERERIRDCLIWLRENKRLLDVLIERRRAPVTSKHPETGHTIVHEMGQ